MLTIPVAFLLALADTLVIFSVMVEIWPITIQIIAVQTFALMLKAALVPIAGSQQDSVLVRRAGSYITLTLICSISLVFAQAIKLEPFIQVLGFFAHLALTLLILRPARANAYLRWTALIIMVSNGIFVLFAMMGLIARTWGRLSYFTVQPNVGAEIAACGALAAALSMRFRLFLVVAASSIVVTVLVQGRAGLVVVLMLVAYRVIERIIFHVGSARRALNAIAIIVVTVITLPYAVPMVENALMLDDKNRGLSTGLAGRTERWEGAIRSFWDHPWTGLGVGGFESLGKLSPHSFFLYGLGELGSLFFVMLGVFGFLIYHGIRNMGWRMLMLAPLIVMMIGNARFLNLNPYPYLMFVLLFLVSVWRDGGIPVGTPRAFARPRFRPAFQPALTRAG